MKINHDIRVTNTNKIIVSQDFGGNKYSKNINGLDGVRTAFLLKSSCYF